MISIIPRRKEAKRKRMLLLARLWLCGLIPNINVSKVYIYNVYYAIKLYTRYPFI